MMAWIGENLINIILVVLLILMVGGILYSRIRSRGQGCEACGASCGCGCGCCGQNHTTNKPQG